MSHKGQTLSFDMLIGSFIFLLAFGIIYTYWSYANIQIKETRNLNDIIDKTFLISQVWLKDGTPIQWGSSDIKELGLQNDHEFNQTKMNLMNTTLGYERVKSLIGINNYDFFFEIHNESDDVLYQFGIYPTDPDFLMKVSRLGIYNKSLVIVDTLVWK